MPEAPFENIGSRSATPSFADGRVGYSWTLEDLDIFGVVAAAFPLLDEVARDLGEDGVGGTMTWTFLPVAHHGCKTRKQAALTSAFHKRYEP